MNGRKLKTAPNVLRLEVPEKLYKKLISEAKEIRWSFFLLQATNKQQFLKKMASN